MHFPFALPLVSCSETFVVDSTDMGRGNHWSPAGLAVMGLRKGTEVLEDTVWDEVQVFAYTAVQISGVREHKQG